MTRRSRGREVALQLLFQLDFNPGIERPVLERFVGDRLHNRELESFCLGLYDGVATHRERSIAVWVKLAVNWRPPRMPVVDRNNAACAYELLHSPDTPSIMAG